MKAIVIGMALSLAVGAALWLFVDPENRWRCAATAFANNMPLGEIQDHCEFVEEAVELADIASQEAIESEYVRDQLDSMKAPSSIEEDYRITFENYDRVRELDREIKARIDRMLDANPPSQDFATEWAKRHAELEVLNTPQKFGPPEIEVEQKSDYIWGAGLHYEKCSEPYRGARAINCKGDKGCWCLWH